MQRKIGQRSFLYKNTELRYSSAQTEQASLTQRLLRGIRTSSPTQAFNLFTRDEIKIKMTGNAKSNQSA